MKKLSLALLSAATIFIFSQAIFRVGYSNRAGAPAGRTGSPFDNGGVACNASGCHVGNPVSMVSGWITSDIPGSGYVPSSTYTITATATFTGLVRFGFEISPQTSTGLQAGTNVITDATNTRLAPTNNPKYVTQTTTGSSAATTPGTKTWTFDWIAPSAGTGTVTFYGAFNCTNNSSSSSGDIVRLCTLSVAEDITTGHLAASGELYMFDVYPNPASNFITLSVTAKQNINCATELVDISGRVVKQLSVDALISGVKHNLVIGIEDVVPGVYFIMLRSDKGVSAKKIIVI